MAVVLRMGKSSKELFYEDGIISSSQVELLKKARGFAPGTIREWSGKKYRKGTNGKWFPVGSEKPLNEKLEDKKKKTVPSLTKDKYESVLNMSTGKQIQALWSMGYTDIKQLKNDAIKRGWAKAEVREKTPTLKYKLPGFAEKYKGRSYESLPQSAKWRIQEDYFLQRAKNETDPGKESQLKNAAGIARHNKMPYPLSMVDAETKKWSASPLP